MTKATMIHPDGSTADVELHTIPADVDRLLGATAEVYNPGDYDGMDGDWSLWPTPATVPPARSTPRPPR